MAASNRSGLPQSRIIARGQIADNLQNGWIVDQLARLCLVGLNFTRHGLVPNTSR